MIKKLLLCSLIAFSSAGAAEMPVSEISLNELGAEGRALRIVEGEVDVAEDFLRRIEVGKSTLVFAFRNQTQSNQKPDMVVKVFNKYGMLLASKKISWAFSSVKPGEVKKEEEDFAFADLESMFAHTGISIPKDWRVPTYITVKHKK